MCVVHAAFTVAAHADAHAAPSTAAPPPPASSGALCVRDCAASGSDIWCLMRNGALLVCDHAGHSLHPVPCPGGLTATAVTAEGDHVWVGFASGAVCAYAAAARAPAGPAPRAHSSAVTCIVAGGGWVYSGSGDCTVCQWGAPDQGPRRRIPGHAGAIACALPLGGLLCSGAADCAVRVWAAATGACKAKLEAHTAPVVALAPSPRGFWSCCQDGHLCLWEGQTFALLQTLREPGATCLLRVGGQLWAGARGGAGAVRVRDAATGEPRPGHWVGGAEAIVGLRQVAGVAPGEGDAPGGGAAMVWALTEEGRVHCLDTVVPEGGRAAQGGGTDESTDLSVQSTGDGPWGAADSSRGGEDSSHVPSPQQSSGSHSWRTPAKWQGMPASTAPGAPAETPGGVPRDAAPVPSPIRALATSSAAPSPGSALPGAAGPDLPGPTPASAPWRDSARRSSPADAYLALCAAVTRGGAPTRPPCDVPARETSRGPAPGPPEAAAAPEQSEVELAPAVWGRESGASEHAGPLDRSEAQVNAASRGLEPGISKYTGSADRSGLGGLDPAPSEAQQELTATQEELAGARRRLVECQQELAGCRQELLGCLRDLATLQKEHRAGQEELEACRRARQREREEGQRELAHCQRELVDSQGALVGSQQELVGSRQEVLACQRQLVGRQQELQECQREREACREELEASRRQLAHWQQEVVGCQQQREDACKVCCAGSSRCNSVQP